MIQKGEMILLALDIGKRIAELRKARGLNQEELSELALLSRVTIAKYESGRVEPGAQALNRIADALEVTTDTILGRSEELPESKQPKTKQARIVSGAIDKMPEEERDRILAVFMAMCSNHPELFEEGKEE